MDLHLIGPFGSATLSEHMTALQTQMQVLADYQNRLVLDAEAEEVAALQADPLAEPALPDPELTVCREQYHQLAAELAECRRQLEQLMN